MKKLLIPIIMLVMISSMVLAVDIATDDFESNSFSGGTGWTGAWSYTGDCEVSTLSNPIDTYHMRGDSACDATRVVDTSTYQNVKVSFYATATSLETSDHCLYYYDDILLLDLGNGDDDGSHDYYEFNVTASATGTLRVEMPTTVGDYCYIDNVVVIGDDLTPDIHIYSDLQYQINENIEVEVTSSLANTQHTLTTYDSNDVVICSDTLTSPSVPYTLFSYNCQLPGVTQNNAYFNLSTTGASLKKTFNIVDAQNDPSVLNIEKVYFSPQVLQGGNTEIFAVIDSGNLTVDKIYVTITYPDLTTRKFSMDRTFNQNEYRAYITDTYQVGLTNFEVRVESGVYYDIYQNSYIIAAYNVDFVNQVNEVYSILTQPPGLMVAGTDYYSGEQGMTFLQLTDGGLPVNNASCKVTVYYPNITIWLNEQSMIQGDNGLQYFPFVAPDTEGIYMITASCEYFRDQTWFFDLVGDTDYPMRDFITGDYVDGDPINLNSKDDGGYVRVNAIRIGNDYFTDVYYNFTHDIVTNITDATLYWMGESNSDPTLTFYWWNWTLNDWQVLPNTITLSATVASNALAPSGVGELVTNPLPDESMNENGTIRIRVYGFDDNSDFDIWTNWLNIQSSNLVGDAPQFLRGGGEIHISNKADLLYNLLNETPARVWNYTPNRNLTYYEDTTNYSLINEGVWNYSDRNLTYFPPQQDLTNYTKIVEDVWNWGGFINPNILSNITLTVWDYVGRYIHGIIV